MVPEPAHVGLREHVAAIAVGELRVGLDLRGIGEKSAVDQEAGPERALVRIAQGEQRREREVAAGAVAAEREARHIDAPALAVGGEPADRGDAVIEPGRELVLGGQAVVDARDHEAAGLGEPPAGAVVAVEAADDPAAAVDEDQTGSGPRDAGVVEADPDRPLLARHLKVVDRPQARPVGVPERLEGRVALGARLDRRQADARGPAFMPSSVSARIAAICGFSSGIPPVPLPVCSARCARVHQRQTVVEFRRGLPAAFTRP